ncbi:MAG: DUF4007 family protein [Bacillota bacterium]
MGFAKHRTFYIREGWLPKALQLIDDKPYIFTPAHRAEAIEELGIGKTMVTSLRFWMQATGLTEEGRGSNSMIEHQITELGAGIAEFDPYFEDVNTLWLIHYQLATGDLATAWYWFFNHFEPDTFNQDTFITELDNYAKNYLDKEVATSSLKKDFLCLKNTYLYEQNYSYQDNPEDILSSPLTSLELITESSQGYRLHNSTVNNLDSEVIYYAILDSDKYITELEEQISFTELLTEQESVAKVFRLTRDSLLKHLEYLEQKGYLTIQKNFGHNLITLNKIDKLEVLKDLYEEDKLEGIRNYG